MRRPAAGCVPCRVSCRGAGATDTARLNRAAAGGGPSRAVLDPLAIPAASKRYAWRRSEWGSIPPPPTLYDARRTKNERQGPLPRGFAVFAGMTRPAAFEASSSRESDGTSGFGAGVDPDGSQVGAGFPPARRHAHQGHPRHGAPNGHRLAAGGGGAGAVRVDGLAAEGGGCAGQARSSARAAGGARRGVRGSGRAAPGWTDAAPRASRLSARLRMVSVDLQRARGAPAGFGATPSLAGVPPSIAHPPGGTLPQ